MDTEGIFHPGTNAVVLKKAQTDFDQGRQVNFASLGDVHLPAALLKSFLRQLPEPLLTYDLYDHIVRVQSKLSVMVSVIYGCHLNHSTQLWILCFHLLEP